MSRYFQQMRHGRNDARRALHERLASEEIGDPAYNRAVSRADGRSVRKGVLFLLLFAAVMLAVTWLGY